MIFLHNPHDRHSRDIVANQAHEGDLVLNWYNLQQQALWIKLGGITTIQSFPVQIQDAILQNKLSKQLKALGYGQ